MTPHRKTLSHEHPQRTEPAFRIAEQRERERVCADRARPQGVNGRDCVVTLCAGSSLAAASKRSISRIVTASQRERE